MFAILQSTVPYFTAILIIQVNINYEYLIYNMCGRNLNVR